MASVDAKLLNLPDVERKIGEKTADFKKRATGVLMAKAYRVRKDIRQRNRKLRKPFGGIPPIEREDVGDPDDVGIRVGWRLARLEPWTWAIQWKHMQEARGKARGRGR